MNDKHGEPLCIATCEGRWAKVVTYDDTQGRGKPQTVRLLFKTAAESAECCRRLNQPWDGGSQPPDPEVTR